MNLDLFVNQICIKEKYDLSSTVDIMLVKNVS